jgi:hypothetical protein
MAGLLQQKQPPPRKVRGKWIAAGLAVVLAVAGGIAWGVYSSNRTTPAAGDTPAATSGAASKSGTPSLAVADEWPFISGCPNYAQLAMPPGKGRVDDLHAVTDIRPTLAAAGAGSWTRGVLYLKLSSAHGQPITVTNIKPHIVRRDLSSPAWIYAPDDGCGPTPLDRVFSFDLDAETFTDQGVENPDGEPPPSDLPTAAPGPGFSLSGSGIAVIRVMVNSCQGNYEWNVSIKYTDAGSSNIKEYVTPNFQSYGVADNTVVYHGYQDPTGVIQISQADTITGQAALTSDPALGC